MILVLYKCIYTYNIYRYIIMYVPAERVSFEHKQNEWGGSEACERRIQYYQRKSIIIPLCSIYTFQTFMENQFYPRIQSFNHIPGDSLQASWNLNTSV